MNGSDTHITQDALKSLVDEAVKTGVRQALNELFLDPSDTEDNPAKLRNDIVDLRNLLDGWRAARRGVLGAVWKAIGTAAVGAVLTFMAWWVTAGFKLK